MMPIDYRRVVLAAVEAALEDPGPSSAKKKKSHLSTGRALVLGAGLVTAGRLVAAPRAREMLESLQHRMGQNGHADDEEYVDAAGDEEPEVEAEEDFDDEAEYPEDEAGGEPEGGEEFDEEPEADEDEDVEEGQEQPEAASDEDLDERDEEEPPAKPARRKAAPSRGRGRARA